MEISQIFVRRLALVEMLIIGRLYSETNNTSLFQEIQGLIGRNTNIHAKNDWFSLSGIEKQPGLHNNNILRDKGLSLISGFGRIEFFRWRVDLLRISAVNGASCRKSINSLRAKQQKLNGGVWVS